MTVFAEPNLQSAVVGRIKRGLTLTMTLTMTLTLTQMPVGLPRAIFLALTLTFTIAYSLLILTPTLIGLDLRNLQGPNPNS